MSEGGEARRELILGPRHLSPWDVGVNAGIYLNDPKSLVVCQCKNRCLVLLNPRWIPYSNVATSIAGIVYIMYHNRKATPQTTSSVVHPFLETNKSRCIYASYSSKFPLIPPFILKDPSSRVTYLKQFTGSATISFFPRFGMRGFWCHFAYIAK